MRQNQLSQFDSRCIIFNKDNGLKIKYNMFSPDLIISRNGKFAVKNHELVSYRKEGSKWFFDIEYSEMKRTYSLDFLLNFVRYGNCDMCFSECEEEDDNREE